MRLFRLGTVASVLLGCIADSNLTKSANSQQILQGDFRPPQVFQNVNLVRNTNLDKGYVRETINVVVENVDNQPQSDYYLPFEYGVMSKVGGIEVSIGFEDWVEDPTKAAGRVIFELYDYRREDPDARNTPNMRK